MIAPGRPFVDVEPRAHPSAAELERAYLELSRLAELGAPTPRPVLAALDVALPVLYRTMCRRLAEEERR